MDDTRSDSENEAEVTDLGLRTGETRESDIEEDRARGVRRVARGTTPTIRVEADEAELEDDDDDVAEGDDVDGDEEGTMLAEGTGQIVIDDAPKVSRKVRRRSRRTRPRSKTIAMKRLTREELRIGALLNPPVDEPRPQTRAQCENDIRPCPWVACKHHLYLDVNPETGSIKINFPDLEPWEMRDTCALDVADRSGITLEEVGEIMNLTRERIRQVEVRGLLKLKMQTGGVDAFDVPEGN